MINKPYNIAVPHLWNKGVDIPASLFLPYLQDNDPQAYHTFISVSSGTIVINGLARIVELCENEVRIQRDN